MKKKLIHYFLINFLYSWRFAGTQLKCLSVSSQEGVSSVWLDASDLKAGMYLYGLLIGDRLIDMKKMVLTN